jgi:hypothetical protein
MARRVVTGDDADGRGIVLSDEQLTLDAAAPVAMIWSAAEPPHVPVFEVPDDMDSWNPTAGGARVILFTVPPSGAAEGKWSEALEDDGFHTSDTVDSILVIHGEIWMELEEGVEIKLGPGDVLVQHGTRHRWFNHGTELPLCAGFIVGAHRDA